MYETITRGHPTCGVQVDDNWEGSPGASVQSGDIKSTRENRLLTWANDIAESYNFQVGMVPGLENENQLITVSAFIFYNAPTVVVTLPSITACLLLKMPIVQFFLVSQFL